MSLRFILGVAVGAAAGYTVGRLLEAKANGVPPDLAFKHLTTSVADLKRSMEAAQKKLQDSVSKGRQVVAPLLQAPPDDVEAVWEN